MTRLRSQVGKALFRLAARIDRGNYVRYTRTVYTPLGWQMIKGRDE